MGAVRFAWDKLKKFLGEDHTWTGTQTFSEIQIQANSTITTDEAYNITTSDLGKTIQMTAASGTEVTFTLPSVGSAEDGGLLRVLKSNTGGVTLASSDGDTIGAATAGSSVYVNRDTGVTSAMLGLEYCHTSTKWFITSAQGTWNLV